MEIILMRHGKPTFTDNTKVTCGDMAAWIERYNRADIGSDSPPDESTRLASGALRIVSSPLPRALSSLKALGCEADIVDEAFREAELPLLPVPGLRLSPVSWAVVFRIMWLCGLSCNAESVAMAKKRAARAASLLVTQAKACNGAVLLMGHGVMNRLIAKELISLGWQETCRPGKRYWRAGVYRLRS